MMSLEFLLLFLTIIPLIIFFINFFLSKKKLSNREKMSPFECGFDPFMKMRIPFSIHFFLITLIFLIFDIEITLLIPIIIMFSYSNIFMIISISLFMIILIIGLYLEFSEQSLEWKF